MANASINNNVIGLKKSLECKDSFLETSIKAANLTADMTNIGKGLISRGSVPYNPISDALGTVQLFISIWKYHSGEAARPSFGDIVVGVVPWLKYVGYFTTGIFPVLGATLTIGGYVYNLLDMIKNDRTPEYCGLPREDDENPSLKDAKNASCPIILDLNGDGIKTTGIASWRYFDHDQSGFAEMTAWADKNDGILALDLNGNGKIDDGREIFGNNTFLPDGTLAPHGYAALAQYDDNHDGKIDSHDEIWEKLRVWRDKNEDAKSCSGTTHR